MQFAMTRRNKQTAIGLGNTAPRCRKCYVHPETLDAYLDGTLATGLKQDIGAALTDELSHLAPEEVAVLAFLQHRLATTAACE